MRMDWKKLLSTVRARDLFSAGASQRGSGEHRSEVERDYGRAIFSTPVRRLQDKAQVFPLEPNDAVRTRLTHSLEVSTLARNMAGAVGDWLVEQNELNHHMSVSVATVAATCGILHDLGNPPFGHAGERAIIDWFDRRLATDGEFKGAFYAMGGADSQYCQDFLNFDGNPQTLRLVSKLQMVSDLHGMNLTCATLSALCKYVARSDRIADTHISSKPGYFASENRLVDLLRQQTLSGEARNPITFLVEAADDLVYATVDLEDAVKKGVLDWEEYEAELKRRVQAPSLDLLNKALEETKKKVDRGEIQLSKSMRSESMASVFRTFAMVFVVPEIIATFKHNYDAIMEGTFTADLVRRSKAASLVQACKDIAAQRVHPTEEILRLEIMGRHTIQSLMDTFWFGASVYNENDKLKRFQSKVYKLASDNYRNVFQAALRQTQDKKEGFLPEMYVRLQLVTDYVCGMTDTFAVSLNRSLRHG